MVKIARILILALLLAGCTSDTIRAFDRTMGVFKVARVFPIDLSSREKQIFHIRGLEKPSWLGRRSDGFTILFMDLCVDSIPDASLYYTSGWNVYTKFSMDGYLKEKDFSPGGGHSPSYCWKVDDSDGWHLTSNSFPAETDFDKTLTIEFQITGSNNWTLTAKSHKKTPSGETPVIEYHVNKDDSVSLSRFKNPRLIIWTGNY